MMQLRTLRLPDYVRQVVREAADVQPVPLSVRARPKDAGNPILIAAIKDEMAFLPEFLAHYRGLGTTHFIMLDNGSSDGSRDYLARQNDVDLYAIDRPFSWMLKQGWITKIIARHGMAQWYALVDADEFLCFDDSETRTLADLAAHAERLGLRRVRGMLVDMYAEGTVLEAPPPRDGPLRTRFPLFDRGTYQTARFEQLISVKGGPRRRAFAGVDEAFNPELTKYPLFRLNPGEVCANPHHIYPYAENFDTPCLIALRHYKFTDALAEKCERAIAAKSYWNESAEYQRYTRVLAQNPALSLHDTEASARFDDPSSFVNAGLIQPIAW